MIKLNNKQEVDIMNETLRTIKTRRSVRKFKKETLSREHLVEIIEAGRFAPSGGSNQTCHIIAVENIAVLKELSALVLEELAKMEVTPDTYKSLANCITLAKKGTYDFTFKAPAIIIVTNRTTYSNSMADSACMLENMMLAAHSLGVGSCWLNQLHWLTDNKRIRDYLYGLDMDGEYSVYGSLALGYPDMEILPPLPRTGNKFNIIE